MKCGVLLTYIAGTKSANLSTKFVCPRWPHQWPNLLRWIHTIKVPCEAVTVPLSDKDFGVNGPVAADGS